MIKRLLKLPATILRSVLKAKRSNYASASDKLDIFLTLFLFEIKLAFRGKAINVKHNIFGYTVSGYRYADLYSLYIEIFVRQIYLFQSKNSSPAIIDCGANIGMSILYFKKIYPDSRIVAFEPNPGAFEILNKNISDNKLTNVVSYNKALSDSNTPIDFYISENMGTVNGSLFNFNNVSNKISIGCEKLSDVIKSSKEKYTLIKMDIEGAEKKVVNDLADTNLLNMSEEYIIEYHHAYTGQFNLASFLDAFEKNGFKYNIKANFIKKSYRQDILIYLHKLEFKQGNPHDL